MMEVTQAALAVCLSFTRCSTSLNVKHRQKVACLIMVSMMMVMIVRTMMTMKMMLMIILHNFKLQILFLEYDSVPPSATVSNFILSPQGIVLRQSRSYSKMLFYNFGLQLRLVRMILFCLPLDNHTWHLAFGGCHRFWRTKIFLVILENLRGPIYLM